MTRAIQKMMLRITAEPEPCAARPKAFVSLGTPKSLKIRYASAPAGAVPPGTTWLMAKPAMSTRNVL